MWVQVSVILYLALKNAGLNLKNLDFILSVTITVSTITCQTSYTINTISYLTSIAFLF